VKTFSHSLGGDECEIFVPERAEDLRGFRAFLAKGDRVLGLDTETTGLDTYSPTNRLRLLQVGNDREAWVLPIERGAVFADAARYALGQDRLWTLHNAPFDLQVIDRHLGVPLEDLGRRVFDTRILAHLLDPRMKSEGGVGLRLKELSTVYVDPAAPDTAEDLTAVFRSYGFTKATGWALIPWDDETYLRYAGLDPILAVRLFRELGVMVREIGLDPLSKFEHHLQILLAQMERRGMRLDVPYVEALAPALRTEAAEFATVASRYGVANVNSTSQVAEALEGMGESLSLRTPSGALKVSKEILLPLADLDLQWERIGARTPNPLADAVLRSKRAGKWVTSYAQAFLTLKDADDRLHPKIGGLQARTARMSVSSPPLQQLPSGDWKIRRSFIPDPGQVIVSADYNAVEMRVLAALADVRKMKEAFIAGEDLHSFTARLVEGDGFTPWHRKIYKGVGFGKVYGGGAATLSRQTGAGLEDVKRAIAAYDEVFPEIRRFGNSLQRRAEFGKREVVTPSGRHLPLDRDRLYAATNYVVQSTARDLLAQAIVDLDAAGLGDHLLLPIHDEILAQAPEKEAEDFAAELGRIMGSTFYGVEILAEPEIVGASWGHGYGAPT
jgi:DNA polymerase-1